MNSYAARAREGRSEAGAIYAGFPAAPGSRVVIFEGLLAPGAPQVRGPAHRNILKMPAIATAHLAR